MNKQRGLPNISGQTSSFVYTSKQILFIILYHISHECSLRVSILKPSLWLVKFATPTLKVAGSNPVGRTSRNALFCKGLRDFFVGKSKLFTCRAYSVLAQVLRWDLERSGATAREIGKMQR